MMNPLIGTNITLRAPEPQDTDLIFLWENDAGFFESMPYPAPVSRFQVWEYIQNYKADPFINHELRLVITHDGHPVGHIDLYDFDPADRRAGVGIFIDDASRLKGLATEALEVMAKYCHNSLGLHQLWAIVAIDNTPSKALFTKCGFTSAGKLRSWIRRGPKFIDALFFQRLFT